MWLFGGPRVVDVNEGYNKGLWLTRLWVLIPKETARWYVIAVIT